MIGKVHMIRRPGLSRALTAVFLAVVLLRASIPVGYMINQSATAHGGSALVLCPTGLSDATVDLLGLHHAGGERPPAPDHLEAPCIFAAVAALPGVMDAPYTLDARIGLTIKVALPNRRAPRIYTAADARRVRAPPPADPYRSAI